MEANKRVVTTDRHEWTLTSPAHHTEVEKAVAVASGERAALASQGVRTGDVHIWSHDGLVIVSFDAERPKNPKRSMAAAEDQEPTSA
ncbi:hypothetical protein ABZU94_10600 [Streptomyces mirabilis]|uniref:hypothetical protein n=1 Tax=Streptomyces sp. NPDC005388 TaxID=3156717 RepID=UPI0033AD0E41